ncbi:hypothetical protein VNO77_19187 [Canavalia gladiata]|uniref:Uncharacterized protein n=1 Tax=Canavalia gladiata TaxID=3824 RepID=A0AAN9LR33_CANGL
MGSEKGTKVFYNLEEGVRVEVVVFNNVGEVLVTRSDGGDENKGEDAKGNPMGFRTKITNITTSRYAGDDRNETASCVIVGK